MVSLVCDGVVSCHKCREWVMHESRSQVLLNTHTCHTTFATKHTCIWFQVFFICVLLLPDRSFKNLGCHCTSVSYIIHDLSINIYACIFHHMELIVRGDTNICWVFLGGGRGTWTLLCLSTFISFWQAQSLRSIRLFPIKDFVARWRKGRGEKVLTGFSSMDLYQLCVEYTHIFYMILLTLYYPKLTSWSNEL